MQRQTMTRTNFKARVLSVALSAVLALLLMLPYAAIPVSAASARFVYDGPATGYVWQPGYDTITGGWYHQASPWLIAYCLDHNADAPSGGWATSFEHGDPNGPLAAVLYWGYPNGYPNEDIFPGFTTSGNLGNGAARYATQLAVWAIQGQLDFSTLQPRAAGGQAVIDAGFRLYLKAQERLPSLAPQINAPTTMTALANPNSTASVRFGPFSIHSAISASVSTSNTPAGAWIGNAAGTVLNYTALPNDTDFYVYVPVASLRMASQMGVTVTANYFSPSLGSYYGSSDGSDQPMLVAPETRLATGSPLSTSVFKAAPLGGIQLTKGTSDERVLKNGNPNYSLGSAEYGVYWTADDANRDANRITTVTTNTNGEANTGSSLPYGTYYVKELAAPKGYFEDTATYTAAVAGADTALSVTDDPILGGIELVKASANPSVSDGNNMYSLAGAEYGIYETNEDALSKANSVGTLVTNINGVARFGGLPMMKYYVKETKEPFGYAQDPNVHEIVVDADGQARQEYNVLPVTDGVTNDPVGVRVQKKDKDTGQASAQSGASLGGAEFTIRYYDRYFISTEAALASGPPTRTWIIVTNSNGQAILRENYLTPNSDPLYSENGFPLVPLGTVLTQETKAPEGYLLPDPPEINRQEVYKDGEGLDEVYVLNEYTQEDRVKRGDALVMKMFVDEDNISGVGIPEEGITFDIYAPAQYEGTTPKGGAAPMLSLTTDEDGILSTEDSYVIENADGSFTQRARGPGDSGALPFGTYLFVQRDTIGFRDKVAPFTLFVSEDGKTSLKTVNNVLYHSAVKIYKEDSETSKKVPVSATWQVIDRTTGTPVEMIVWYPEETHITEFVSNENGELMMPERLPSGIYELKEITAPAKNGTGYVRNPVNVQFDIPVGPGRQFDDPLIVTMKDDPGKGQITVIKSDGGSKGGFVGGAVYAVTAAQDIYTLDGTLRAAKGAVVDTITTGADGKAKTKALYLGRYAVQEKTSPAGYILDTAVYEAGLAYGGQDVAVVQKNVEVTDASVKLELAKLDSSTEEAIPGAQFAVSGTKASGGTYTDVQTSDKDGHVLFEYIPPGSYTLSELQKVPGYFTNDTEYTFTVDAKGAISGLPAEGVIYYNDPTVLELDKVDGFTGEPLAGAEFTVSATDGRTIDEAGVRSSLSSLGVGSAAINTLIADMTAKGSTFDTRTFDVGGTKTTVTPGGGASVNITTTTGVNSIVAGLGDAPFTLTSTTDAYGHAVFKYIPEGEYALTEVGNPDTYLLEDVSYEFEVTARGDIEGISSGLLIENMPTAIEFGKIDSLDMIPLPGVEFTLSGTTFAGGPYGATAKSDGDGRVVFRYIPAGDYSLAETDSPEGYFNDGRVYGFRVNGKGEVVGLQKGLVIENAPSVIEFHKIDSLTRTPLKGAEFTISGTTLSGKPYEAKNASLEDGHVKFMYIPAGSYTLSEAAVPDGYVLPDASYSFEIDVRGNITGLPEDLYVMGNTPTMIGFDKTDSLTGGPVEGAEFLLSGMTLTGGPYEATAKSDDKGHVRFGYIPKGGYTLSETANPDGYVLEDISYGFTVDSRGEAAGFPEGLIIENTPTAIEFDKTDSLTGDGLEGAEFTLLGTSPLGKAYETVAVSDSEGHVRIDYILEGNYTLTETANPDGYILENIPYSFSVNSHGEVAGFPEGLVIGNAPTTVEMDKTDVFTGDPLAGAEFKIAGVKKGGDVYEAYEAKAKSDNEGHVIFRYVPEGDFELSETASPDGYVLPQISYRISVDPRGEVTGLPESLAVGNAPTTIELDKADSLTGRPLEGAEFTIAGTMASGGPYKAVSLSDSKGHVIFRYVPEGDFELSETANPSGYMLPQISYRFSVDPHGKITGLPESLAAGNAPTTIEFDKVDSLTSRPLEGAEFTVSGAMASGGPYEAKAVSDSKGHVKFTYVPEGSFELSETASPDGYVLPQISYRLNVNSRGEVSGLPESLAVVNAPTTVELDKVDALTGGPLEGAEFTIAGTTASGGPYKAASLSDSKGHVKFAYVPEGSFTLAETANPDGYLLEDISFGFDVDSRGEVLGLPEGLVVENSPTVLEFDKVDSLTGEPLMGAAFRISGTMKPGGPYEAKAKSDNEGRVRFDYIPEGSYTLSERANPDGYFLKDVSIKFRVNANGELIGLPESMAIGNFPTTIEFSKADVLTGQALPDVEFSITGSTRSGKPYEAKALSDNEGKVVFSYIPAGRYTLAETANPDGYLLEDISYGFTVNTRGAVIGLPEGMSVENLPTIAEMYKVDGFTGDPLPGAEFSVTGRRAIDADAVRAALEGLGAMGYEIEALLIAMPEADGGFEEILPVAREGEDVEARLFMDEEKDVTISIPEKGEIDIPGLGDPGYLASAITDGEGHASFTHIPEGYYSLAERASPDGYVLGDARYDFRVNSRGEVEGLPEMAVFENMPTAVEIYKKDKLTGLPVEGVGFTVSGTTASGEPYEAAAQTDSEGHTAFRYIPEGAYTLRETMRPEGYIGEGVSYEFAVGPDGEIVGFEDADEAIEGTQLNIYNTPTTVSVDKLDLSDGTPVEGAELELYREGDEYPVAIWTTTGEPYEVYYLSAGEYILREAKAPLGYVKADDVKITVSDKAGLDPETGEAAYTQNAVMYDRREIPAISPKTADTVCRVLFLLFPAALFGAAICIRGLRGLRGQKKATKSLQ